MMMLISLFVSGTQFFISLGDCSELDGKNVVFGKVVEGIPILYMLFVFRAVIARNIRLRGLHVNVSKQLMWLCSGKEVLEALNDLGTTAGSTKSKVTIHSCGEL